MEESGRSRWMSSEERDEGALTASASPPRPASSGTQSAAACGGGMAGCLCKAAWLRLQGVPGSASAPPSIKPLCAAPTCVTLSLHAVMCSKARQFLLPVS